MGYAAITHTFQPMKSIRSDIPWYKYIYIYISAILDCTDLRVSRSLRSLANYLKFLATDFSLKTISPSAGENSGDLA